MRWWAFWRRVQYGLGFFTILALIGVGMYYKYAYQAPTCFDGIQNTDEKAVDCGGSCTRICAFEVIPPKALWSESFKIIDGQYNAVAYIENRNERAGTPALKYTLKLFDAEGLITEREGVTVLPPDSEYPVFEGRIMTGDRVPTNTTIEFTGDTLWLPGEVGREQFTLEKRELVNVDTKPKLVAELQNKLLDEAQNVDIIATIFDTAGNPLTAARTIVEYFPGRTTKEVVFTWPEPISKTLRSCETPTDVVVAIDLSGSMNNDGGTPPEPITSVLTSAQSFVSRLKTQDSVGVVTYATRAELVEKLTVERDRVAKRITTLSINPKEEQGSTNTGEALAFMREELGSARHSTEARKIAIILTDGLATAPDPNPDEYAQREAQLLKSDNIQLFTIGLGAQVHETFLKSLASSQKHFYKAPTIRDLDTIYTAISKDICEDGPAVIEIIPKTETTFAPLQ